MSEIDARRAALSKVFEQNAKLLTEDMSEADVRAKLIDPLFRDALGWPETCIRREIHDDADDYWDYLFQDVHPYFIVEAKRASEEYDFPKLSIGKTYALPGLFRNDKKFKATATQAARYCQDAEQLIPYAVVTNGIQLAVFRAQRSDRSWLQGSALVFASPQEIVSRFSELWDLLSYPAVKGGSLSVYFSHPDETPRQYKSVIETIANADETLLRNRLSSSMIPVLKAVFDELTDERHGEILRKCYVYTKTLERIADDFILTVRDLPPRYLRDVAQEVKPTRYDAGEFQALIYRIAERGRRGTVLLLLGGVGSGKTTFLRKMRVQYCAKVIEDSGAYFYVDFRGAPSTPPFEDFVFSVLRAQLNADQTFQDVTRTAVSALSADERPLDSPSVLRFLFQRDLDDIDALAAQVGATNADDIAQRKLELLQRVSRDDREVVARAFRLLEASDRFILLALDNADQLDLDYQMQIFLFAESVASHTGANVISALREEKYYLASQKGAFSAYQSQPFHIASPRLSDLLSLRLNYARDHLGALMDDPSAQDEADVRDFFEAIRTGGVGAFGRAGSSNVVRLLEKVSMGNMRVALRMFRTFVSSGNTRINKILQIYRDNIDRRVPYYIPFHEFTKSVMLGDYRYYSERHSDVVNLFALSGYSPGSHFTALRVLQYLMLASNRTSPSLETGFVELGELLDAFALLPAGVQEARAQLQRLLKAGLVEGDTGVASDLDRCRALRATASGEYYLTFLARAFAYLDLVWIDTPVCDAAVLTRLRELADARDKDGRFERVDLFLRYLRAEEERERTTIASLDSIPAFKFWFVPKIIEQIEKEKVVIAQNYNRYARSNYNGDRW